MRFADHLVPVLALASVVGCLSLPEPPAPNLAAGVRPGVAFLARGTAFDAPGAREQVAALLGEVTARPVRSLAADPPPDAVLKPIAKSQRHALGHYRWREPQCSKRARPVLTAIATRADAIYRIRLDARTTTRPATDQDRATLARPDGPRRLLGAVGLGRPDTVYETRLDGTVERTTFPSNATVQRSRVRAESRRIGRAGDPPPADLREAVGSALAALPPAAPARWDGVARWLESSGCPFAAYAVGETLVSDAVARRRLRSTAMAAMRRRGAGPHHEPSVAERRPPAADTKVPPG